MRFPIIPALMANIPQSKPLHSTAGGKELLKCVQSLFPKLEEKNKKGDCGRIAVIGGSQEYTGAPYFAAISSLKFGADILHVFCPKEAATVIKSYSPELIVHPLLSVGNGDNKWKEIFDWLDRVNAVVIGPGLGRNDDMLPVFRQLIEEIKKRSLSLVVDADGLHFAGKCNEVFRDYKQAILTPNFGEFSKLYKAVLGDEPKKSDVENGEAVRALAKSLGHLTIVQKGNPDHISDGKELLKCDHPGSPRRCGGQGDLLSGSLAPLAFWAGRNSSSSDCDSQLSRYGPTMIAGYTGCMLTRECSNIAYEKAGRTMTTTDLIDAIPELLDRLSVLK